MGGACSVDGEERGVYRVLVGKPEGKRPLGRPRRRWEDNISAPCNGTCCTIKIYIKKKFLDGSSGSGVWGYGLDKDRDRCRAIVNTVLNLRVQ
jgi:hypothetical protein